MTYQEIFAALSELESTFYYASDNCDRMNLTIEQMHDLINAGLLLWHEYTGCTNETDDKRVLPY